MRLKKDGTVLSDEEDVEVNRTEPQLDECKMLLLHVVKQAVDDYKFFKNKPREDHVEIFTTASGFLFSDTHFIEWGELQLNLEQICNIVELEVGWVREKICRQLGVKLEPQGTLVPIKPTR